jgi:hypothetical protein
MERVYREHSGERSATERRCEGLDKEEIKGNGVVGGSS